MSKKSGGNEAAQARQDEQERQARIRAGTQRVNTIFDGGTYGTGALGADAAYDPNTTYYRADGSVWTPPTTGNDPISKLKSFGDGVAGMATGNGGISGLFGSGGNSARAFKDAMKDGLFTGTAKRDGFNDGFFDKQRDNYINYAMPQVDEQRGKANREMTFALSRSGQLEGSTRADLSGELQKRYELQSQKVKDDGLAFSTQTRNNVEGARTDLIGMLNATGDAEGAAKSAISRAAALSQPAAYSPLTNMFADFTGALGTQAAAERAFAYGGPRPTYNTGLFAPRSGAVSVT
jgi:hypothetical protein